MNTNKKLNMTMLCDFYELTMGNGYFKAGYKDRITHFDLFFRSVPDKGGYAIAAGLEQVIEYIQDLHFEPEDIEYLRSRKMFDEGHSWTTWRTLSLPGISSRCRREPPSFPMSPF